MTLRGSQFLIASALALVAMSGGVLAEESVLPPIEAEISESAEGAEAAIPELVLDETSAAIRDLIADAGHHGGFLDKSDAAAVAEFYAERNYSAAWLQDGVVTDELGALIARIRAADVDGLDPSAFTLPTKGLINYAESLPFFAARTDLMLSQAC